MSEYLQEIVPINKEDLFIILNHPNAKFDYPVHYHPEYEINLVMNCTGTRVVGDSEEAFGPTDLVMTGPSLPHAWKSEDKTNHVITIQFSKEMVHYPMLEKRIFAPIRQLLQDSEHGLSFEGPEQEAIKKQIISLTRMQGFQSVTTFLNILNAMANANRKRLVTGMYEQELGANSKSRRIAKVCEHIDRNLDKELSLSEVAALVNFVIAYFFVWKERISQRSVRSFFRHFIAYNAASVGAYLIKFVAMQGLHFLFVALGWFQDWSSEPVLCNLLGLCFSGVFNFFMSEFVSFGKPGKKKVSEESLEHRVDGE